MQNRFEAKKRKILELLETPDEDYQDLSPKGSVDETIRPLITDINGLPGLVTTSSCSGRVSVFCEGQRSGTEENQPVSHDDVARGGPGGKGRGAWLYISHDPVPMSEDTDLMSLFGLQRSREQPHVPTTPPSVFIHLKFEPMILHILSASLSEAQQVLSAALGAGFRESGAVSLTASKGSGEPNPMVAIRSTGYSFDSIIGYQDDHGHNIALVHDTYLRILIGIANERFKVNEQRISRLKEGLLTRCNPPKNPASKPEWEDPEVRRRRKREEGLAKKKQLAEKSLSGREATSVEDIDDLATVGSFPEA